LFLQDYLKRIAYDGGISPSLGVLEALLAHHVQSVPFENLDVQLGISLTTDPAAAYEKIVLRQRGGWCYEQNGLFGWALSEAGFDVTRVAAAVMRIERGDVANANHLCLLVAPVDTDQTFLVDVGFGGSMIAPIPLAESDYQQAPFRVGLRRTADSHWRFWEDLGKGEFSFDFRAETADEDALSDKCNFLQTDPSSGFVQNLVAQIRLPDQHTTLRGKVFSVATSRGIETTILSSADELLAVLSNEFRLDVPAVRDLWPRIEERHAELMREKELADTYEIRDRANNKPLS
jgi:N-hydroxyarylamine O-acetyltransferase